MYDQIKRWVDENSAVLKEAWQNIKDSVEDALTTIMELIEFTLDLLLAIWKAVWPIISTIVKVAWDLIKDIIEGAINIVLGIIQVFAAAFAGDWDALWKGIVRILAGAWQIIWGVVKAGMKLLWEAIKGGWKVISDMFRDQGDYLVSILKALGQRFYDVGAAIVRALADGIRAAAKFVTDAVDWVMEKAGRLIPNSPAKEGPFSGSGWTFHRGRRFIEDLAAGLGETLPLERALSGLMGVMDADLTGSASVALAGGGYAGSGDGGTIVNIMVSPGAVDVSANGEATTGNLRAAFDGAAATLAEQIRVAIDRR
jgi:hypothetical protein